MSCVTVNTDESQVEQHTECTHCELTHVSRQTRLCLASPAPHAKLQARALAQALPGGDRVGLPSAESGRLRCKVTGQ